MGVLLLTVTVSSADPPPSTEMLKAAGLDTGMSSRWRSVRLTREVSATRHTKGHPRTVSPLNCRNEVLWRFKWFWNMIKKSMTVHDIYMTWLFMNGNEEDTSYWYQETECILTTKKNKICIAKTKLREQGSICMKMKINIRVMYISQAHQKYLRTTSKRTHYNFKLSASMYAFHFMCICPSTSL